MDDLHLIEKKLSSEELLKGRLLHVFRDRVELPDGATTSREYVVHPEVQWVLPDVCYIDNRHAMQDLSQELYI